MEGTTESRQAVYSKSDLSSIAMVPGLRSEMLYFRINEKNISELSAMDIGELG